MSDEHVTRGELDTFRMWIEERFRSMTWKLALAAFAGGAVSNVISGFSAPVTAAVVATVGVVGYVAKLVLVAFLHH